MKVISVFNQKGGVGKTTTNINLAAYLAVNGHKVLIIDIDPQGNSTSGLGIDKKKVEISSYHLLTDDISLEEAMIKSELIENLYIVPSTIELAGAEIEMIDIKNREKILREKVNKNDQNFEFVFIDCPPSLGLLTLNALSASTSVLIPIQCEYYALEGVSQLVNTIQLVKKSLNKELSVEGVILTMYDNRTKLCNEVSVEVKKYFGDKVFESTIPRNIRLAEAPSFGLPIMLYDDKCKGAESYEDLTKEFIKRQEVK
ncbi:ParA family protein [Clostridium cellulovorans]|uniref:Sporulation initiation inhibitor protein Soj n=1 Tax=Clostridium cellulovorans (strain ATCC 35296 / DSM 3052 / OCM 3 / 743B) TaxID=573061 RepID=D9SPD1_CLOC7|nr:ParA family protein [Clostridium cellulovorans]ADL54033.1 sporulation initiation inhibitor protein soj [Clostridium cellulovorans 743B]